MIKMPDGSRLIQTDGRGRFTLSGHPSQQYRMTNQADGSVLLIPADSPQQPTSR